MALSDFLIPEDVRTSQFDFLRSPGYNLRSRTGLPTDRRSIEQRIRNVRGPQVQRIIDAVEDFQRDLLAPAWAHYMSLSAGRHLWPDANHRTGAATFVMATKRAWSLECFVPEPAAKEMVRESKKMRDDDFLARGRYYTVVELRDPGHPYRQLFETWSAHLRIQR